MKKVTAYQADDGQVYPDRAAAGAASILHLGKTENRDSRGQSIGPSEVAFLIQHRKKIAAILLEIDAPEGEAN